VAGSHRHLVPADQQFILHRSLPTQRHAPSPVLDPSTTDHDQSTFSTAC
jgi:hypothetical protein